MCSTSTGGLGNIPDGAADCSSYNIEPVPAGDGTDTGTGDGTDTGTGDGADTGTGDGSGDGAVGSSGFTSTKVCTYNGNPLDDDSFCKNPSDYYGANYDGNSMFFTLYNERNTVTISKKATTGEDEVPGADIKICKKADYDK